MIHFSVVNSVNTDKYERIIYEVYRKCQKVIHPEFSIDITCWSMCDVMLSSILNVAEDDADCNSDAQNKFQFISHQIPLFSAFKTDKYTMDYFQIAFRWYSVFRSLYSKKLSDCLQLPRPNQA